MSKYSPSYASIPNTLAAPDLPSSNLYGGGNLGRAAAAMRRKAGDLVMPVVHEQLYPRSSSGRKTWARLAQIHNSQLDRTGIIVCNGPSLRSENLELLQGQSYILMNRGYLLGEEISHGAQALCVHDPLVIGQFGAEIGAQDVPLVSPARAQSRLRAPREDDVQLAIGRRWAFATTPTLALHHGATVTFWALQLGFLLGWSKCLIIGMDHRFRNQDDTLSALRTADVGDTDHFSDSYTPAGTKFLNPNIAASEYSYHLAKSAWEADGRSVVDCTTGGACQVFDRGQLADELASKAAPVSRERRP